MIVRATRFAGAATALIAGAFAVAPALLAQGVPAHAGIFDSMMRSGVSGVVRDRSGHPQIGVLIELLDPHYNVMAQTFTDDRGRYRLPNLRAGLYQIKASTSLYLPTIRPDLRLLTNSKAVINLTLSTLYQALEWLPATPRTAASPSDDWDWTLRLSANRPLLRMFDPATIQPSAPGAPALLQTGDGTSAGDMRSQLILAEGPRSFGQGGLSDQFLRTAGNGESRALLFSAQSAENFQGLGRIGATAAYRQQLTPDRSMLAVMTLTGRPQIEGGADATGLTTLRVRSASAVQLGPAAELTAGTELAIARMGQGNTALGGHPFAGISVHTGNTILSYNLATAPTLTAADQLEQQAQQDMPAVVEQNGTLYLEQGLHQQFSVTHQQGRWTEQAAVFQDSLDHPAVEGALAGHAFPGNAAEVDSRNVLYDPGTGTIAVSGAGYHRAGGVLAMLRDQLDPGTWLSLQYALGEAVSLPGAGPDGANLTAFAAPFAAGHTSMLAVSGATRLPLTGTTVRAGYRWQPGNTLTPVAPFDSGIPDAYLSFALRQPLHLEHLGEHLGQHMGQRLGAGRVEAIVDVRNLLAQGYRPFVSQDGTMVYFAQEQRCIAAGLAFSF